MPRHTTRLRALRAAFGTASTVAPSLAARFAEQVFCRPPRRQRREGEDEFLATGRALRIAHDDIELAAWRWGETGPLAILVHGWGSCAGRWLTLAPALVAEGCQVVAYDAPAHGASGGYRASLPQFTAALQAVQGHLGIAPDLLVGHSLGGSAIVLAMQRGVPARRAVLLSAPAEQRIFAARFAQTLGLSEQVHDLMIRNLSRTLHMQWDDLDLPPIVHHFSVPALIIHDRDDPEVPFAHAEAISAAWPGAELLATAGMGHGGALTDPAILARIRRLAAG